MDENEEDLESDLFVHAPLQVETQKMRLLKVLPNLSRDGLVRCEMQHVRLEDDTPVSFDALSYKWGSDNPD